MSTNNVIRSTCGGMCSTGRRQLSTNSGLNLGLPFLPFFGEHTVLVTVSGGYSVWSYTEYSVSCPISPRDTRVSPESITSWDCLHSVLFCHPLHPLRVGVVEGLKTDRCGLDNVVSLVGTLDAKTDLLTGLLTGIQDWKRDVTLSQTCYGSKSLKVILMDSNFGGHPVLNPPVTLWSSPTSSRTFFEGKKFIFFQENELYTRVQW